MVGAKPLVVGGEDPSVGSVIVHGWWVVLKVVVDMAHMDILCVPHQMFMRGLLPFFNVAVCIVVVVGVMGVVVVSVVGGVVVVRRGGGWWWWCVW